jgi:hypothetical protein
MQEFKRRVRQQRRARFFILCGLKEKIGYFGWTDGAQKILFFVHGNV